MTDEELSAHRAAVGEVPPPWSAIQSWSAVHRAARALLAEVDRLRAFEHEFLDDCIVVGSEEMTEKHGRVLTERKALREENARLREALGEG